MISSRVEKQFGVMKIDFWSLEPFTLWVIEIIDDSIMFWVDWLLWMMRLNAVYYEWESKISSLSSIS